MHTINRQELINRMFLSEKYAKQFIDSYECFLTAGLAAHKKFDHLVMNYPQEKFSTKAISDYKLWKSKVVPNFNYMLNQSLPMRSDIKNGSFDTTISAAGSLRGLSKSMDGIFEAFMNYLPYDSIKTYRPNLALAQQQGSNLEYSHCDYWRDDEILDSEITGKIDSKMLLQHLKPGEKLEP